MSDGFKIVVLIKQVPDTSSAAGVNPDGTVDRARAKKMMNPFDKFALQKAIETRGRPMAAKLSSSPWGRPPP